VASHRRPSAQPARSPSFRRDLLGPGTLAAALLLAALTAAVLVTATSAGADEPDESTVASELVREAIALIVNTPGNVDAAREKVGDALEVDDQEDVDIALVRRADRSLADGDLHNARSLLERSIGARPHAGASDVAPIGEVSEHPMARGDEPGDAPILDPLDTSGLGDGDLLALGVGAILVLAGGLLGWRWRPSRTMET
jgi:hypothetical protein